MQSKWESAVETMAGTSIGFFVALATWAWIVNPLYGFESTASQGLGVTVIFTVISIVRGYYVRRFFNWLRSNKIKTKIWRFINVLSTRYSRKSSVRQGHDR